jgi:apolipoprotein D and lipocalin family protein
MRMKSHPALAGGLCFSLAACSNLGTQSAIRPAAKVDLARYMGPWRVIACTDNPLERSFVDAQETYRLRSDGEIHVHFTWRSKSFDAPLQSHDFTGRVVNDGTNARWKMHLFPLFTASYIIAKVTPDYSEAVIAHPSRKFGWLLARNRTISERDQQKLIEDLQKLGYDPSIFIRVPQVRHDLGARTATKIQ